MDRRFYHTAEFARKAAVTVRTLRYYDQAGLLSPSGHTAAGHRLYSDADLVNLEQILALKFLGFSLAEIRCYLQAGPLRLQEVLAKQKAMLGEKRLHLDTIMQAIEETEKLVQAGSSDWDSIVRVIQVIQMEQKNDWVKKYFTPEQRNMMETLSEQSYSAEARATLAARGEWTEEDQKRVDKQYAWIAAELQRLVAAGQDPGGSEAQAVAKLQTELLHEFTQGVAAVETGLKTWWKNYNALPNEERPPIILWGEEEAIFLSQAMAIYRQQSASSQT